MFALTLDNCTKDQLERMVSIWIELWHIYTNLPLCKNLAGNMHQSECDENHSTILRPYKQLPK